MGGLHPIERTEKRRPVRTVMRRGKGRRGKKRGKEEEKEDGCYAETSEWDD